LVCFYGEVVEFALEGGWLDDFGGEIGGGETWIKAGFF
jgi:hypothetical protein